MEVFVMGMTNVRFEIPEEILYTLNESLSEFTSQVRLFTALQLFNRHKLSLGKAAVLAGLDREQFMVELDRYEIPMIDYDPDELEEELKRFEK
jgi:predicted HTH domain antitoxin